MITAKEALAQTMKYHNCQDKISYYEKHIDENIRKASAEKGQRQVIIHINENEFTDLIVNHISNLLLEKEFGVQVGSHGYSSILMISW